MKWHPSGNAWADGPKPRTLLGVADDVGSDTLYPQRCGYVVGRADHPFFAGTGLANGDVFGRDGRNGGGACGWEVDTIIDSTRATVSRRPAYRSSPAAGWPVATATAAT